MAVRLYVEDELAKGAAFELGPEQTHYLSQTTTPNGMA